MQHGFEHTVIEMARLARVAAFAECGVGDVVLVLSVLAVEQLRGDHHRCGLVEQRHIEREHRQVAMGEADHPRGHDADTLPGRRAPHE